MSVHLNITIDEELYRRLKRELPPKGISAFINEAVRARLRPSRATLDAAYRTAAQDPSRGELAAEWDAAGDESWPE